MQLGDPREVVCPAQLHRLEVRPVSCLSPALHSRLLRQIRDHAENVLQRRRRAVLVCSQGPLTVLPLPRLPLHLPVQVTRAHGQHITERGNERRVVEDRPQHRVPRSDSGMVTAPSLRTMTARVSGPSASSSKAGHMSEPPPPWTTTAPLRENAGTPRRKSSELF